MGVINPELKTFKQKVSPAIGGMSAASTKISDSIQELSTCANSVKSDIDSNYDSVNKTTILSKFGEVDELYKSISSSVESTLQSLISGAQGVIDLVTKLENINNEIDAQQEIINSNSGTESSAVSARNTAQSIIDSKNKEFDETQERALTALSSLKAQDGSVQEAEDLSASSTSVSTEKLEYGTFELKTFTSSTGETIDYYVYVPKNAENVDKLPAMLYLHGSTSSYNDPGWSKYGLTGLIQSGEVTPSGIVIMPHIKDHKDTTTLKELTDYVVNEYNCDTNKISISGHSSGAIATYRMINTYPDYFSCAVPISGCNYGSITEEAFGGMNVWAFGGSEENGDGGTSTPVGQGAIRNVNRVGGNGKFTVLGCGHAATDEKTFQKEYESPTGETINPLDWAMQQTKA